MLKHAFASLIDNKMVNLISIGTITISLLIFSSFQLISVNLYNWVQDWGESHSMSVYLEDGIDKKMIDEIRARIKDIPGAEIKKFISKEEALKLMAKALSAQEGLLEGLKNNPLPASFEIHFIAQGRKGIKPADIKSSLEKFAGVDEVQYNEQWVERFEGIVYFLRLGGMIIGGMLCLAVLFIITNTIKLNIYSRREEIEIYKLVGATDWFIKFPYLIEGTVQGAFSGLFTVLLILIIYSVLSVKTVHMLGLPMLNIVFLPLAHLTFLIFLSVSLGLLGAYIAVGRFFKLII
jgi:cell division transport system permease protein